MRAEWLAYLLAAMRGVDSLHIKRLCALASHRSHGKDSLPAGLQELLQDPNAEEVDDVFGSHGDWDAVGAEDSREYSVISVETDGAEIVD